MKELKENKDSTRNSNIHKRFLSLGSHNIVEALPNIVKKGSISRNADLVISPIREILSNQLSDKRSLINVSKIYKMITFFYDSKDY